MDVVDLHEVGFENAVATLGTAITSEQARVFSRYTKKVIISYDSDQAGQNAAYKAFNLLQEVGVDVKILKMVGAKDPDEYIKNYGVEKFKTLLDESRTRFDFEIEKVLAKYDIDNIDGKIKAAAEICKIIATFDSRVERDLYCQRTAEILNIPKNSLLKDVETVLRRKIQEKTKKEKNDVYRATSGIGDRINIETVSNLKAAKIEESILGLMQLSQDLLKIGVEKLSPEDFITEFNKRIFESMKKTYEECGKFDISFIGDEFNPDEISRIVKMLIQRQQLNANDETILTNIIDSLKELKNKSSESSSFDNILDIIKNKK